jgi:predicted ATPase
MSGLRQEIADALSATVHRQSIVQQSAKESDEEHERALSQFKSAVIKHDEEQAAASQELGRLENYHKALGMSAFDNVQA